MVITQSNITPAIHLAAITFRHRHRLHLHLLHNRFLFPRATAFRRLTLESAKVRAFSNNETQPADIEKLPNKPPICTADELHYVTVNNSDWRLALWRYTPSPQVLFSSFVHIAYYILKMIACYCVFVGRDAVFTCIYLIHDFDWKLLGPQ